MRVCCGLLHCVFCFCSPLLHAAAALRVKVSARSSNSFCKRNLELSLVPSQAPALFTQETIFPLSVTTTIPSAPRAAPPSGAFPAAMGENRGLRTKVATPACPLLYGTKGVALDQLSLLPRQLGILEAHRCPGRGAPSRPPVPRPMPRRAVRAAGRSENPWWRAPVPPQPLPLPHHLSPSFPAAPAAHASPDTPCDPRPAV